MKALKVTAFVLISIVLGDLLARYIDRQPVEMPWLTGSAQWILRIISPENIHNPDTVEFVSGIVLLALSTIGAGIALYAAVKLMRAQFR